MSAAVASTSVEAATITTTSAVTTAAVATVSIAATAVAVASATIAITSAVIAIAPTVIAAVAKADPYPAVRVRIAIVTVGIAIGVIRIRCGGVGHWRRIGLCLFGLGSTRVVSGLGAGIAIIGNLAVVAIVLVVGLGCIVVRVRTLNWS